jgi:hypothetical protein
MTNLERLRDRKNQMRRDGLINFQFTPGDE